MIRTQAGLAWQGLSVKVVGGRFALNGLNADGKLIDWYRQGPLSIDGMVIDGTPPSSANPTLISFNPASAYSGQPYNEGQLNLSNMSFYFSNSYQQDLVSVGQYGEVNGTGNMCLKNVSGGAVSFPCTKDSLHRRCLEQW